ncbi:MAG: hypothetical protein K9K37_08210 [Desulfocapsa sp.]|nr:hypothetical protein [Desulfocapsa sp.]
MIVAEALSGQKNWTQLIYSRVRFRDGSLFAVPGKNMNRFKAMAAADSLIEIPEGCAVIEEGSLAEAWFFR